jgi:intracellular septation protein
MSEEMPETPSAENTATQPKPHGWLPLALDFGPLLVFFLTYKFASRGGGFGSATVGALTATGAFMIAILIAVAVSQWKLKRVSPMLWLSAVLVIGFGALTIYFHDERFIQIKPTIIYGGFAVLLIGGWLRGKPLIKYLLQAAYDGLSDTGWMVLSRNWGIFFAGMAVANEAMRATLTFDTWLTVKVWGVTAVSFLFAMSQLPVMMRHGLVIEEK